MNRITRLYPMAAVWLAALSVLLASPVAAYDWPCTDAYIQCLTENGGSTQCIHDTIDCVARAIVQY
jgi:hypothetical protein